MANTNVDALNNGINNSINFQEVYRGTITTSVGANEIVFDSPFVYDGNSNVAIQFCFDNAGYTNDDLVSAYESGYASSATLKIDNINGCPNSGNSFDGATLPVITFGEGKPSPLYATLDKEISSSANENETAFLSRNDSILMFIHSSMGNESDCISASLVSNTNTLQSMNGTVWQDKVYYIANASTTNEHSLTLILPNTGEIDWNSEDLTGLYTEEKIEATDTPSWESLNILDVIINEPYTFVTIEYNGDGSYAVGGTNGITAIDDISVDFTFDAIEYHDVIGRKIYLDETTSATRVTGLYIKSYLFEGKIVKSEKVVR